MMAYQIKQLATLAGVSVRTLRYYDEIGLLKPAFIGDNGYRYYETPQINRLQRICLYRQLQIPLATMPTLLDQPAAVVVTQLQRQYQQLQQERRHLDQLLTLMETTIAAQREGNQMNDQEKFAAFKQTQLDEHEVKYGAEARQHYGEQAVKSANQRFSQLSATDYATMQATEQRLLVALTQQLQQPTEERAAMIYQLHRDWLGYAWAQYQPAMHRGLAQLYLADPRFRQYYDGRAGNGATAILVQCIEQYTEPQN